MTFRPNSQPGPDAVQRQQWDGVAAGWEKWWPTIERGAEHVSQRMLELGGVVAGQRVLDIATGIGEPALRVAKVVGSTGSVVATDLSPRMLAIARQRATELELTNVEFLEADAAHLHFPPASFETILCRWGITSLPQHTDILMAIHRMLSATGTFVTAVWEERPESRPLATLAQAVVREMASSPSHSPPAVADPMAGRQQLAEEIRRAGFRQVHLEDVALTLHFSSRQAA